MLTAKELVNVVKDGDNKLEPAMSTNDGTKIGSWRGSVIQMQEVTKRVKSLVDKLNSPHVNIKSSLSEGEWNSTTGIVKITRNSGKQDLGSLLRPEEALYLMENNSLLVTRAGGVPLSLQQGYSLLLDPEIQGGLNCMEYVVYSKLTRAGFKVVRHQLVSAGSSKHTTKEFVTIDPDIDPGILNPLYGHDLQLDPGQDPPVWLQEIREGLECQSFSSRSVSLAHKIVDSLVKEMIDLCFEKCTEISRKRPQETECSKEHKRAKSNQNNGNCSPKYEAGSEDELTYELCERCVRRHEGGESGCNARQKLCRTCGRLGHVAHVHKLGTDEEFRDRIRAVLDMTDWELWGKYTPDIVTIEEDNNVTDLPSGNVVLNPFHQDDCEDEDMVIINDSTLHQDDCEDEDMVIINDSSVPKDDQDKVIIDLEDESITNDQEYNVPKETPTNSPSILSNNFTCELCEITCNSQENFQSHQRGRQHKRNFKIVNAEGNLSMSDNNKVTSKSQKFFWNLRNSKMVEAEGNGSTPGNEKVKSKSQKFFCNVCNIEVSGKEALKSHFDGKKHLRVVVNLSLRGIAVEPSDTTKDDDVEIVSDNFHKIRTNLTQSSKFPDPVPTFPGIAGKKRHQLLNDIPDCFNKTLLIQDRPSEVLLPNNTWPVGKHSAFIEVEKFKSSEEEAVDTMYEPEQKHFMSRDPSDNTNIPDCSTNQEEDKTEGNINMMVEPSISCDICSEEFADEREWNIHTTSQSHLKKKNNIIEIDLTESTFEKVTSRKVAESSVTKPFRGFWPIKEITVALASVGGQFTQSKNFGYYTKPNPNINSKKFKPKSKKMRSSEVIQAAANNLTKKAVEGQNLGAGSLSSNDVQRWVSGIGNTLSDLHKEAVQISNNDEDCIEVEEVIEASNKVTTPVVDIVDLSSDDESLGDPTENVTKFSSNSSKSISMSTSNDHDDVSIHSDLRHIKTGPLASLWTLKDQVGPLVCPEMGASLREIYNRIRMEGRPIGQYRDVDNDLVVTFDLYLSEHYKKNVTTSPDYRIVVQNFMSPVPSCQQLVRLDQQVPDQVPVLFAVVNGATVTFLSLDHVDLPSYFNNL